MEVRRPLFRFSPSRSDHFRHARLWNRAKAGGFLDGFSAFVRGNINKIAALTIVVQRPRELTRAELKALKLVLDDLGYSETNLRRAWSETKTRTSPPRSSALSVRPPLAMR